MEANGVAKDRGAFVSFFLRMLPDRRQVLTSSIRILIGVSLIWGSVCVAMPYQDWVHKIGMFGVILGVFPLLTKPEGVVTDAIADFTLLRTKSFRDRLKMWWVLQTTFNGDRQAMDRALRNCRGE